MDCLTDDCNQTKAGDVSSAGELESGWFLWHFLGCLHYMPDPSRARPHRGAWWEVLCDAMWTLSSPFLNSELYIFFRTHSLSLFTVKRIQVDEVPCCNVGPLVLIVWLESSLLAHFSNNLLSSCLLSRRSKEQEEIWGGEENTYSGKYRLSCNICNVTICRSARYCDVAVVYNSFVQYVV